MKTLKQFLEENVIPFVHKQGKLSRVKGGRNVVKYDFKDEHIPTQHIEKNKDIIRTYHVADEKTNKLWFVTHDRDVAETHMNVMNHGGHNFNMKVKPMKKDEYLKHPDNLKEFRGIK